MVLAGPPDQVRQKSVLDWLDSQEQQMIALLRDLVNIDSGSYDKAGVDAAGRRLMAFLEEAGVPFTVDPDPVYGDMIRAHVDSAGVVNRSVLLLGHRDTVFSKREATRRPFTMENGRGYGPGVADMKAGLVANSFVLAALARFGGGPAPVVGLFTSDEEIASPSSRDAIEEEARRAVAVFNTEPGRANGNIVIERRGCIFIRVDVTGKPAHSGVNFADGISAIEELARKIVRLHALNRPGDDFTVNVGLVSGGQSVNTVAPNASAELDIRYFAAGDRDRILGLVRAIVEDNEVAGTSASMNVYGEFPPLNQTPASKALFRHYQASARSLGIELDGQFTAGASDSGFAAAAGAPVICGLGPVGGGYHSDSEYVELRSILERTKVLALAILTLPT